VKYNLNLSCDRNPLSCRIAGYGTRHGSDPPIVPITVTGPVRPVELTYHLDVALKAKLVRKEMHGKDYPVMYSEQIVLVIGSSTANRGFTMDIG
jgi:hypothetical protein